MASWMIDENDPARLEIARRARALGITGTPEEASHPLGEITLANGSTVNAHVVHAVDPIITDGEFIVMINRKHDPGMGKPALPGGFIDPTQGGGVESAIQAATTAFESWKRTTVEQRASMIHAVAGILRERKFEFAAWMVYEVGKNWAEADADIAETIDFAEF